MATILACGKRRRTSRNMPLPTTWLGRQAKGWQHTILGTPCSMSSTISAVSSQPSPAWLPRDRIRDALSAMTAIGLSTSNFPPQARRAARAGAWTCSMNHTAAFCRVTVSRPMP